MEPLKLRKVELAKDYPTLCKWWKAQNWPQVHPDMLPQTGFIVEGFCAGFLYRTDSSIAWMEFIIANPDTKYEERSYALDALIDQLSKTAKELGFQAILASVEHQGLIERYEKHNFVVTDKSMTNLIRKVG